MILDATIDQSTDRGEVLLSLGAKKKGADGVRILETDGNKLGRLMGRVASFGSSSRAVIVQADSAIDFPRLEVLAEEVTSEVQYKLELKLDLRTPGPSDDVALRRLAHAFRSASLQKKGQGVASDLRNAPEGILRHELENYLRSNYRTSEQLSQHMDPNWLAAQAAKVESWLSADFGLDARAKLKVEAIGGERLSVEALKVKSKSKDSEADIYLTIRLTAELVERKLFAARALRLEDLENRVSGLVDRYLRGNVTLQEYRFTTAWQDALKLEIAQDLRAFERTLIEFQLSPPVNGYVPGPHIVEAGGATFQPAGWNANQGQDDHILFSCNAQVVVEDAARFERMAEKNTLFSGLDISKTGEILERWLGQELQEAVRETLHPIHRDDHGYAELLSNWPGDAGYRAQIQDNLERRGQVVGLALSNVVATPARDEMRLLDTAIIDIPSRKYQSSADNVSLEFSATAEIKVASFDDIRGILNRTNRPLDEIRDKHIVKPLERLVRQIGYNEFFGAFEYGPWPAKAVLNEGEAARKDGCVGWLKHMLAESLSSPDASGERIELVNLTLHQSATEHSMVYDRLTNKIPERLAVELDIVPDGAGGTTEPYEIAFDLSITGLSEFKTNLFFRDWATERGNVSEYELVRSDCAENLAAYFDADQRDALYYAHKAGPEGKLHCEKVVQTCLDAYLDRKFGLSGTAVSIMVHSRGGEALEVIDNKTALEIEFERRKVMRETELAKLDHLGQASKEMSRIAAEEAIKDAKAGEPSAAATSELSYSGYKPRPPKPIAKPPNEDSPDGDPGHG